MSIRATAPFRAVNSKFYYTLQNYNIIFVCLQKHVSCCGSADECAALTSSLLSLETWLWSITADGLKKLSDSNTASNDYSVICHYTISLLGSLYEENFLVSLLYIARCCTNDQYSPNHLASLVNQAELNMKHLTSAGNPAHNTLVESLQKVMR